MHTWHFCSHLARHGHTVYTVNKYYVTVDINDIKPWKKRTFGWEFIFTVGPMTRYWISIKQQMKMAQNGCGKMWFALFFLFRSMQLDLIRYRCGSMNRACEYIFEFCQLSVGPVLQRCHHSRSTIRLVATLSHALVRLVHPSRVHLFNLFNLSPTNLIWFCDNFFPALSCPAFRFSWLQVQPVHCLWIKIETLCHPRVNVIKTFYFLQMYYSVQQPWFMDI